MDGRNVKLDLRACKHCQRTFVPESLAKHEPVCKNVQKKRKPFDPAKQRVTEDLSLKQIKAAQKKDVTPKKSHWRQKHEEFIRNIRAAKGAQIAMERGDPLPPPPPPSENPDYVQCPYCNRRFSEKAAERHISFCKEQSMRGNAKRIPSQQEQARAAAKGYQPPKPKGRGTAADSPAGRGGYGSPSRGGYSNSTPAARGAPARGTPPGAAASKSDMGRMPGGPSSGSRAPAGGATRGRAAPAPAAKMSRDPSGLAGDPMRVLSGKSVRLTPQDSKARPNSQENSSHTRGAMEGKHLTSTYQSPPSSSKLRGTDSGYHSSNSESEAIPRVRKARPSNGVGKFCHECGTKYPTLTVKFCPECGIKKLEVSHR